MDSDGNTEGVDVEVVGGVFDEGGGSVGGRWNSGSGGGGRTLRRGTITGGGERTFLEGVYMRRVGFLVAVFGSLVRG